MEKSIKITTIISGSFIFIALIMAYVIFQLNPSETISTSGDAQIEVIPDLMTVNFNIQTEGKTASEAKTLNDEKYNNLVKEISLIGLDEDNIKTSSFSVNLNYEWVNGKRIEKGYLANHYLKIELMEEEFDKIGSVIDAGVNAEVLINYINFELSESLQKEKKSEATIKATEEAKEKAEAIAEGLGKKLGKIVSVSDSSFNYNPWPIYSMRDDLAVSEAGDLAKDAVQEVSINPSEQTVYSSVSVMYRIR